MTLKSEQGRATAHYAAIMEQILTDPALERMRHVLGWKYFLEHPGEDYPTRAALRAYLASGAACVDGLWTAALKRRRTTNGAC